MGYVACFWCACAGPIGHGYGLDGALGEFQENYPDQQWGLDLNSMKWISKLQVITGDANDASPVMEYEDYGMVSSGDRMFSLNPISWQDMSMMDDDTVSPGIPVHEACLPTLSEKLVASGKTLQTFFEAYHGELQRRWTHIESLEEGAEREAQEEGTVLSTLIPAIQYGDNVLAKCDQVYEFSPGDEWLVCSPRGDSQHAEWSARNQARIEAVVAQLVDQFVLATSSSTSCAE